MIVLTLARKPLDGTVAANVRKHGCGGLNIDGARIGAGTVKQATAGNRTIKWGVSEGGCTYQKGTGALFTTEGRWPANLILSHLPKCDQNGTKMIQSDTGYPASRGAGGLSTLGHKGQEGLESYRAKEEEIVDWKCVEECPVRALNSQSKITKSSGGGGMKYAASPIYGDRVWSHEYPPSIGYGDTGGASKCFKQIRSDQS